jgi:hypothetical protein
MNPTSKLLGFFGQPDTGTSSGEVAHMNYFCSIALLVVIFCLTVSAQQTAAGA